jgi:hypothetical protein
MNIDSTFASLKKVDLEGMSIEEWCKKKCLEQGVTEEIKKEKSWVEFFEFLFNDKEKVKGNHIFDFSKNEVWKVAGYEKEIVVSDVYVSRSFIGNDGLIINAFTKEDKRSKSKKSVEDNFSKLKKFLVS